MRDEIPILLAEDYDDDIALLQRAFQKAEVGNVQVVRNGDDAVDYLTGTGVYANRETHPFPSVMLIDIKMPRKSGLEVLEWIRRQEGFKRLPVIVLTSSQNLRDINQAHDLGANSYLVKPSSFQELTKLIKTFAEYWLVFGKLPTVEDQSAAAPGLSGAPR